MPEKTKRIRFCRQDYEEIERLAKKAGFDSVDKFVEVAVREKILELSR